MQNDIKLTENDYYEIERIHEKNLIYSSDKTSLDNRQNTEDIPLPNPTNLCKNCHTWSQKIKCTLRRLSAYNAKLKRQTMKEKLLYRRTAVINNQKQFIYSATGKDAQKIALDFVKVDTDTYSSDPEIVKNHMKSFYQTLYQNQSIYQTDTIFERNLDWKPYFDTIPGSELLMANVTKPFLLQELTSMIKSTNLKSASGPDELNYEHFKLINSSIVHEWILSLLNYSLKNCVWPKDNNKGNIILLLKRKPIPDNQQTSDLLHYYKLSEKYSTLAHHYCKAYY